MTVFQISRFREFGEVKPKELKDVGINKILKYFLGLGYPVKIEIGPIYWLLAVYTLGDSSASQLLSHRHSTLSLASGCRRRLQEDKRPQSERENPHMEQGTRNLLLQM
jgi:hypothetical protein